MKINKDVIHREIAGEHILVPTGELALSRSGVFVITELGAEIWEMLQEEKEYETIFAELLEAYEVEEDILRKDMDEFFEQLREVGLLLD